MWGHNLWIYHMQQILTFLFKDWANPLVAKHIRWYPVISRDGIVSEVWHGKKWHYDLDRHLISPVYDAGNGKHYFVDEAARLRDGHMIVPVRWLEDNGGAVSCDQQLVCLLLLIGWHRWIIISNLKEHVQNWGQISCTCYVLRAWVEYTWLRRPNVDAAIVPRYNCKWTCTTDAKSWPKVSKWISSVFSFYWCFWGRCVWKPV